MSDFHRRLPEKSMGELERLVSNGTGWWPDLLAEWAPSGSQGELRLAVRNGYMNFYSKGQSIAKISFGRGGASPTMRIHEKYVKGCSDGGQRYTKLSGDTGRDPDGRSVNWRGPKMLQTWVRNSRKHSGVEKSCIDALVGVSPKVIDLEMGLPAFCDRKTALRVDMVALEGTPEDIRLVFWEAKMIGDQRLRSKYRTPRVFEQIDDYRRYLGSLDRRKQVTMAYRNCCRVICDLHAMATGVGMTQPLDRLIKAAGDPGSSLEIDETPRLVIFHDGKNRNEDAWEKHFRVLRDRVRVAIVEQGSIRNPLEALA